jgi:hypothetical protein
MVSFGGLVLAGLLLLAPTVLIWSVEPGASEHTLVCKTKTPDSNVMSVQT